MRKPKRFKRYQFEGYWIEQGAFGWYVCDWDFIDGALDTLYRARSEWDAINWICRQYGA